MRRKDREVTDIKDILEIVKAAKIMTLSMFDGDYPYGVPLHYGYEYIDGKLVFYMHSAKEGHKLDLIKENPNVCVTLMQDNGVVSGGDVVCSYGAAFASVIGKGRARILTDSKEKIHAIELLMENQTGKSFEINEQMAETVEIIRVDAAEFSAKRRIRPENLQKTR